MKPVNSIAAVAILVGALAGCSADPVGVTETISSSPTGSCTPTGQQIESISFAGVFGSAPEVTFDAPLEILSTQRLVISKGEGRPVVNGDDLVIDYSLYNAASGALIEESGYDELSPTVLSLDTEAPNFVGVSLTAACLSLIHI